MVKKLYLTLALEECLEAMEHGETDLDALAGRYPGAEQQIRPLLGIAAKLREYQPLHPLSPQFLRDLEERLRTEAYR